MNDNKFLVHGSNMHVMSWGINQQWSSRMGCGQRAEAGLVANEQSQGNLSNSKQKFCCSCVVSTIAQRRVLLSTIKYECSMHIHESVFGNKKDHLTRTIRGCLLRIILFGTSFALYFCYHSHLTWLADCGILVAHNPIFFRQRGQRAQL